MKNYMKNGGLIVAGSLAGLSSAMADVPASITTAISGAGVDSATVAASVLVVIVGIFAIKLLRKAL